MVDFEQLELELVAFRVLDHSLLENIFRRFVASVSEIDLGLGNRIDLVGVNVAHATLAEITEKRGIASGGNGALGVAVAGLISTDRLPGKNAFFKLGNGLLAAAEIYERDSSGQPYHQTDHHGHQQIALKRLEHRSQETFFFDQGRRSLFRRRRFYRS